MPEDYMKLYAKALAGLETGGKTLEASLQEIEEGKKQAIGRGQQALVSGGLAGTTVMGGVPLQAEKIAARQRLGARGRAEETYLTTLASFAAFAQRGQEAQLEREAAMERLQTSLRASAAAARGAGAGDETTLPLGMSAGFLGDTPSTFGRLAAFSGGGQTGGGQAQQFPSLYGQAGPAAPNLGGGGVGGGGGGRVGGGRVGGAGAGTGGGPPLYPGPQGGMPIWVKPFGAPSLGVSGRIPEDLYMWKRAGFESPEAYEDFTGRPGSGTETISKTSPEWQQYVGRATQPQAMPSARTQASYIGPG